MHPRDDLIERLAAADPAADSERLSPDEQREADELLARLIATPPGAAAQRRKPRGRTRRWALATAAVVGVAAAALAAIDLLDSDAPGTDVVERAVAAVNRDDVIYHYVERRRQRASYEPNGDIDTYVESWHTSDGRIHQRTFAAKGDGKGKPLDDWAGRRLPGRRVWPRLRWEAWTNKISEGGFGPGPDAGAPALSPLGDHGRQLRTLQEQGRLRVAGTTKVAQGRAYRLVSEPVEDEVGGVEQVEFLVDADTYLPLEQRFSSHRPSDTRISIVSRYLIYESLPLTARNERLLHLDPHPGAKCSRYAGELRGKEGVGFPNPCPSR